MGILITNQENIRTLNMTYRNLDEPTDVSIFLYDSRTGTGERDVYHASR